MSQYQPAPYLHSQPLQGPVPKASGATASLVLGILGLVLISGLFAILAVVFGHSARKRIRKSNVQLAGSGEASAGLVLGYLVIAFYVIGLIIVIAVVGMGVSANSLLEKVSNEPFGMGGA